MKIETEGNGVEMAVNTDLLEKNCVDELEEMVSSYRTQVRCKQMKMNYENVGECIVMG